MDKIIGLGNALVDVLTPIENDDILEKMHFPKGSMTLIDEDKFLEISKYLSKRETQLSNGGSAGNTVRALAKLDSAVGFVGKVGDDRYGTIFKESLQKLGIEDRLFTTDRRPSGVASTFISPDGERTMATFLGAAATLQADELTLDMFQGYAYLLVEGYLVQDHELMLRVIELAKEAGLQVCLDLASYNIVEEHLDFFKMLVAKYVDVLFANELEARAFTGLAPRDALDALGALCSIAVVKVGAKGSYVKKGTEEVYVPASDVTTPTDTTGAGDFFAAGFLYGLTSGIALEKCARLGSMLAGYVIRAIGTDLPDSVWEEVRRKVAAIKEY